MATLLALMTMTKSPPSTLGANVGLCLPRSRLAAATARRPSTTSVASMTCHDLVVSPAFGVYVGTALTTLSLRASVPEAVDPGVTGCRSDVRGGGWSRRPTLTRGPGVPHANGAAYRPPSPQVKMTVWSRRLSPVRTTQSHGAATSARSPSRPLPRPHAGRPAVGVGHLARTVADRISELGQHLVERGRRPVPFQLLSPVRCGRFTGPELLQRRDVRPQRVQRGIEAGRCRVNFLAHCVFDFTEVVGQHRVHGDPLSSQ